MKLSSEDYEVINNMFETGGIAQYAMQHSLTFIKENEVFGQYKEFFKQAYMQRFDITHAIFYDANDVIRYERIGNCSIKSVMGYDNVLRELQQDIADINPEKDGQYCKVFLVDVLNKAYLDDLKPFLGDLGSEADSKEGLNVVWFIPNTFKMYNFGSTDIWGDGTIIFGTWYPFKKKINRDVMRALLFFMTQAESRQTIDMEHFVEFIKDLDANNVFEISPITKL